MAEEKTQRFEKNFRTPYQRILWVAILDRAGLKPFRDKGQHLNTVVVECTKLQYQAAEALFAKWHPGLGDLLQRVTEAYITAKAQNPDGPVSLVGDLSIGVPHGEVEAEVEHGTGGGSASDESS